MDALTDEPPDAAFKAGLSNFAERLCQIAAESRGFRPEELSEVLSYSLEMDSSLAALASLVGAVRTLHAKREN